MYIEELQTPAILLRSKAMYKNIEAYQAECHTYGKKLWPMVKTHKSTILAEIQKEYGADGFLCGTLDECEALVKKGFKKLMYAYPVADEISCKRVAALAKQCDFYARIDSVEAAAVLDKVAAAEQTTVPYTVIIDCGLHRFGVQPSAIVDFAKQLDKYQNLSLRGVSTHSGHVYAESDADRIEAYAKDEIEAVHTAVDLLRQAGYEVTMISSGSTPTFRYAVKDDYIQVYHPGNYVFNDCIQISNGTACEEECALVVYATIISHPREDLFICDAGAKCLGLDLGAHGNMAIRGYGRVLGHPEAEIAGLSEEVGKIRVSGDTTLKIGTRIMIVPNHSCSSANLTDYYAVIDENGRVERAIPVDIRGNKRNQFVSE